MARDTRKAKKKNKALDLKALERNLNFGLSSHNVHYKVKSKLFSKRLFVETRSSILSDGATVRFEIKKITNNEIAVTFTIKPLRALSHAEIRALDAQLVHIKQQVDDTYRLGDKNPDLLNIQYAQTFAAFREMHIVLEQPMLRKNLKLKELKERVRDLEEDFPGTDIKIHRNFWTRKIYIKVVRPANPLGQRIVGIFELQKVKNAKAKNGTPSKIFKIVPSSLKYREIFDKSDELQDLMKKAGLKVKNAFERLIVKTKLVLNKEVNKVENKEENKSYTITMDQAVAEFENRKQEAANKKIELYNEGIDLLNEDEPKHPVVSNLAKMMIPVMNENMEHALQIAKTFISLRAANKLNEVSIKIVESVYKAYSKLKQLKFNPLSSSTIRTLASSTIRNEIIAASTQAESYRIKAVDKLLDIYKTKDITDAMVQKLIEKAAPPTVAPKPKPAVSPAEAASFLAQIEQQEARVMLALREKNKEGQLIVPREIFDAINNLREQLDPAAGLKLKITTKEAAAQLIALNNLIEKHYPPAPPRPAFLVAIEVEKPVLKKTEPTEPKAPPKLTAIQEIAAKKGALKANLRKTIDPGQEKKNKGTVVVEKSEAPKPSGMLLMLERAKKNKKDEDLSDDEAWDDEVKPKGPPF